MDGSVGKRRRSVTFVSYGEIMSHSLDDPGSGAFERSDCSDDVSLAGLSNGPLGDGTGGVQHEDRRRPHDVPLADQVEVRLGVHLDGDHAVNHLGNLREDPSGGAAGLAESSGELHEGCPLAQLDAEVGRREDRRPAGER